MILDVTFWNAAPVQYQGVRMTTVYPHMTEYGTEPQVVFHFNVDLLKPQVNISLHSIKSIMVTND